MQRVRDGLSGFLHGVDKHPEALRQLLRHVPQSEPGGDGGGSRTGVYGEGALGHSRLQEHCENSYKDDAGVFDLLRKWGLFPMFYGVIIVRLREKLWLDPDCKAIQIWLYL